MPVEFHLCSEIYFTSTEQENHETICKQSISRNLSDTEDTHSNTFFPTNYSFPGGQL